MLSMAIYCWCVYRITGEYPSQAYSGTILIGLYFFVWEVLYQGWRGWDTVQDTWFTFLGVLPWYYIDMGQIIDRLFIWVLLVGFSLTVGTLMVWKDSNDAGPD